MQLRGTFSAAIAGGVIGAALTAALLVFATPQSISSRIVRQGMLADPQVLRDAASALQRQDMEQAKAQQNAALGTNRAAIETPFASSWKGSAKPDVTLVEFFDYACPYCKAVNPVVDRLIAEDKGLRVVYRELPIIGGQESVTAARLSLAASKAGRFAQFHDTLWAAGRPSPDTLAAATSAAGIPQQPPSNDQAIEAELTRNMRLAEQLRVTGTPLFVIGDKVINAYVPYDELKKAIADARAKG
ncbi:MAG: DsbA family protein [Sphingomicrobium sp.]